MAARSSDANAEDASAVVEADAEKHHTLEVLATCGERVVDPPRGLIAAVKAVEQRPVPIDDR